MVRFIGVESLSCRCGEDCQGCELMAEVESIAASGLAHEINWALRQKVTRRRQNEYCKPGPQKRTLWAFVLSMKGYFPLPSSV